MHVQRLELIPPVNTDVILAEVQHQQLTGSTNTINGLAFLSHSGEVTDGFNYNLSMFGTHGGKTWLDGDVLKTGMMSPLRHTTKTPLFPIIGPILKDMVRLGMLIGRVRMSLLKAGDTIVTHRDSPDKNDYCVKFHIPLNSNPGCEFVFGKDRYHLDPGSVYLTDVAKNHSFVNAGDTDRYHIIGDCIVYNKDLPFYCHNVDEVLRFHARWQDIATGKVEQKWLRQDAIDGPHIT